MSIGSKIKAIRKKRGITQYELSNGIISRGMLSLIESDSAYPSIQSLFAIAKRLEIPPSFLLEEGDSIQQAEEFRIATETEREFLKKNYQACLDILTLYNLTDDKKFAVIYVECAFHIALESFNNGNFALAEKLLKKAESLFDGLPFPPSKASKKRICFLQSAIKGISELDSVIENADAKPDFEFEPSLFFSLLKLIKIGEESKCRILLDFCTFSEYYASYISAQLLIKEIKLIDAIFLMKTIVSSKNCPVFLKLMTYSSMENCCKMCEDYKGAYENRLAYLEALDNIIY